MSGNPTIRPCGSHSLSMSELAILHSLTIQQEVARLNLRFSFPFLGRMQPELNGLIFRKRHRRRDRLTYRKCLAQASISPVVNVFHGPQW
jgi:hypothetical protein